MDQDQASAIELRGVTKRFAGRAVVQAIDLAVPQGCSFGFVGPNGAGKTTTMSMLSGVLLPTDGDIRILGHPLSPSAPDVKRLLGVVPDEFLLAERLRIDEILRLHGLIYGVSADLLEDRVEELIARLGLSDDRQKAVGQFSHGMKKRVAFAAAIIHEPPVMLLDEPFEGMDPLTVRLVATNLKAMVDRGATLFLTSHILELVERLCERIAILDHGRVLWQGRTEEVRERAPAAVGANPGSALERVFLEIVGQRSTDEVFSWLR